MEIQGGTYSWIVVKETTDHVKRNALLGLLRWMLTDGQKDCSTLAYTPLLKDIANCELEVIRTLK